MDLSFPELMTSLIFGTVGFVCFMVGKKQASWKAMIAGVGLIGLPYMVQQVVATWIGGALILAVLYVFRE